MEGRGERKCFQYPMTKKRKVETRKRRGCVERSMRDETLSYGRKALNAHLVKPRDAFSGPRSPGEEHDASAETGLFAKVGTTVAVDDVDDSVRELLPALTLVRTGCMSAHGQASVKHEHACLGPRGEVPVDDMRWS